ncbi:hypothetical protein GP486_005008 [Trichoglossum hirsutum]|uniref:Maleylacetoacetate isomerase n=1 Tax=Trichoglossum hirsutum TaxID=265104 RepID=A0A9P8LA09_9PEZI|nr:hypothetical protein GP486_005008 [Trichoglossum hirsutum]
MPSTTDTTAAHLHSYFRSSCSARVRTACHLKGIPLTYSYVDLLQGEHRQASYTALNPSGSVPTLTLTDRASGTAIITLGQSVAILELLEEYFPDTPALLPARDDVLARARVRQLVNVLAADVQPLTNMAVLLRVQALGADHAAWARDVMARGFAAYEKLAEGCAGRYSVGDCVTLADVMLAPAVEAAKRWGLSLDEWPVLERVYGELMQIEAFRKGSWREQEDTPLEFRTAAL